MARGQYVREVLVSDISNFILHAGSNVKGKTWSVIQHAPGCGKFIKRDLLFKEFHTICGQLKCPHCKETMYRREYF